MIDTHRVFAFPFRDENRKQDAYWRDVGTLDAYYEANMDLVAVDPLLNMYDERWPIRTYQPNLPPPKFVFAEDARRRPPRRRPSTASSARARSSPAARCERSILGPNVPRQQLRPGRGLDPVRRRRYRPARRGPPGDHRQGRAHSGRHADRLRPRARPRARLHRQRERRRGDRQGRRRRAFPGTRAPPAAEATPRTSSLSERHGLSCLVSVTGTDRSPSQGRFFRVPS